MNRQESHLKWINNNLKIYMNIIKCSRFKIWMIQWKVMRDGRMISYINIFMHIDNKVKMIKDDKNKNNKEKKTLCIHK